MKKHLMPLLDKVLLRKRCIVETLFDKLKSSMGLEHTRHRSPINALVHILSSLAATTLAQPKVKMGEVPIPSPVPNLPTLSSPVPELGLQEEEGWRVCSGSVRNSLRGSSPSFPSLAG
ncbi:MAG TPA: hypothetical protein DD643_06315 [Synechococcus sp. UBA8638]|nr:hypothetical protein [Synechococcus sp. UBA8638]